MNEPQLLLETSARAGQVGLWAHGELRTAALDEARRHARDLASAVRSLLDAASLRPADVRGIVVGLGPGSYTGLRVGVMAAKAFAYATGCTFVGVPTFDAIAAGVGVPCVVIGDALQGMVYVRKFAEPLRIARAADEIPTWPPGTVVAGPGVSLFAKLLEACDVRTGHDRPTLAGLRAVAATLPPVPRDAMLGLEPLYLRGSSAEEKLRA